MRRRELLLGAAASLATFPAFADTPKPPLPDLMPPLDDRAAYIAWMQANRSDDPAFTGPALIATRCCSTTTTSARRPKSAPSC